MDRKIKRPPKPVWRRPGVLAIVGVLLVITVGWRWLPETGSTNLAVANVVMGKVTRGSFEDYLPVRAAVAPEVTTLVGTMAGGQVERLLVDDGQMVTRGQPLATLVNPELTRDVFTREAEIAGRLGDLSGQGLALERNRIDRANQLAQADYDFIRARRELSIREQLHSQGFLADAGVRSFAEEAEYQQRRAGQLRQGQASEARIARGQEERIAETRSRLTGSMEAVRAGLDALTIRSPVAGRLTNFTIQPGQMLSAGDPAGQVDSEGAWKLIADVDEYFLGRVAAGQAATGVSGVRLRVSRVLPAVTDGRFRIELGFDGGAPPGLNRGQTIDIRVTLGAAADAVRAPVGGWLESGGGTSAFVLDADGRHARRRDIRVGRRNPEYVEILSGLQPGERIVTSNTSSVSGNIINLR